MLDRAGRVKIADFGLAKMLGKGPDDFTLTGTQQVMGTPKYMAPEQIERPSSVDHRADIFSLGYCAGIIGYIVLWICLPEATEKLEPPPSWGPATDWLRWRHPCRGICSGGISGHWH